MPRLRYFGVNLGHYQHEDPAKLRAAGFNALRIPAMPDDQDLPAYLDACRQAGVAGGVVFSNETLAPFPSYQAAARYFRRWLREHAALYFLGNESDAGPESAESSRLSAEAWNRLADAFRPALAGEPVYVIGTVTGDPNRLAGYNLAGFTGLDNHAYAQTPETVGAMLAGYDPLCAQFGLRERIVSEYGWPHPDPDLRGRYLAAMARAFEGLGLVGAFVYCWDLAQHPQPFGVMDHGQPTAAVPHLQALGYGDPPPAPPTEEHRPMYEFILGVRAEADRLRAQGVDVGEPLENETYPFPGAPYSFQTTTTGLFVYSAQGNVVHFFRAEGK